MALLTPIITPPYDIVARRGGVRLAPSPSHVLVGAFRPRIACAGPTTHRVHDGLIRPHCSRQSGSSDLGMCLPTE